MTSKTIPSLGLIVIYLLKNEWPMSISISLASFRVGRRIIETASLRIPETRKTSKMVVLKNIIGRRLINNPPNAAPKNIAMLSKNLWYAMHLILFSGFTASKMKFEQLKYNQIIEIGRKQPE